MVLQNFFRLMVRKAQTKQPFKSFSPQKKRKTQIRKSFEFLPQRKNGLVVSLCTPS